MTGDFYQENAVVKYSQNQDSLQVDNCCLPWRYDWYHDHYHYYYPTVQYIEKPGKTEQAFKIVTKLIASKIIEREITVKELIKMVNDIAEIL